MVVININERSDNMPGRDKTGPMGMGSMTGRRAGQCTGFQAADTNILPMRGAGKGFRRGMGFRWRNVDFKSAVLSSKEEASVLKTQASCLQNEMIAIRARIEELESGND